MKKSFLVVILFLFCIGCNSQKNNQLSHGERNQIRAEVKAVLDSIMVRFVNLDAEGALKYYSIKMSAVGHDSIINYDAFKKIWYKVNTTASSIQWTQKQIREIALSKDYAITNLMGRLEIILKSGKKVTIDPQFYSDVYKKINGQWKVIYEHGSGTPVITEAANK